MLRQVGTALVVKIPKLIADECLAFWLANPLPKQQEISNWHHLRKAFSLNMRTSLYKQQNFTSVIKYELFEEVG